MGTRVGLASKHYMWGTGGPPPLGCLLIRFYFMLKMSFKIKIFLNILKISPNFLKFSQRFYNSFKTFNNFFQNLLKNFRIKQIFIIFQLFFKYVHSLTSVFQKYFHQRELIILKLHYCFKKLKIIKFFTNILMIYLSKNFMVT